MFTGLGPGSMPKGLDPRNKISSRFVWDPSVRPGRDGRGEEARAFQPSILEPKTMGGVEVGMFGMSGVWLEVEPNQEEPSLRSSKM